MFNSAIVDESVLHSFILQAVKENYVSVVNRKKYKEFLSKRFNLEIQRSLDLLVLFDKIYLPIEVRYPGLFNFDKLIQEGLVGLVHEGFDKEYLSAMYTSKTKGSTSRERIYQTLEYLSPLFKPYIYDIMNRGGMFDKMMNGFRLLGITYSQYHCRRLVEEFIKLVQKGMDVDSLSDSQAGHWLRAWMSSPDELVAHMLAYEILSKLYIFDQSAINKLPIVSDFFKPEAVEVLCSNSVQPSSEVYSLLKAFNLFKVVISDIKGYQPCVNSIQDVLRIREDKRVHRFRKRLGQFIQCIAEGDIKDIDHMRRAILDASISLKKIGPYKKLTRWTTYLSLPIGIAECFIGYPIVAISMGLIAAASQAAIDYSKIKHDWILFGSNA